MSREREAKLWHLWTAAVLCASAAMFYAPALRRTGGSIPVPLDDVYIYFGFARSTALGHPFEHFPGNGFSSGATSVLYPLLLAPAWAIGFRGTSLGAAAALLALACLFDLCRSLRAIGGDTRASWLFPLLVVGVPLVDWSWWSGMETALFGAALGRALLASHRALNAPPHTRAAHQWRAGAWLALLPLTRPESIALALALGIAVVHGARALATLPSLARALGPCALTLGAQALVLRALTGEWEPAGAVRKLVLSPPYTDGPAAAVDIALNGAVLGHQAFVRALGGVPGVLCVIALIICALFATRRLTFALLFGVAGGFVLVCLNSTARYQNYRYAVPLLAMLLCAAAIGAAARRAAPAIGLAFLVVAQRQLPQQIDHFAQASRNIAEQHGEVARRLAAMQPRPRRVLVGDAGAIPYLAELPVLDGLGLGGFRGLPFARASVHGLPAVVELIERLPPDERPDAMALYPGWWPGVADTFGHPIDRVRITGNVICGGDEKVMYAADWSLLAMPDDAVPGELDRLDVADLVEERAHDFAFPAPHGGWIVAAVLRLPDGVMRWDAGRIVPAGKQVAWTLDAAVPAGPATLRLRSDRPCEVTVAGRTIQAAPAPGRWVDTEVGLEVRGGDRLTVTAVGTLRLFHVWLTRPDH